MLLRGRTAVVKVQHLVNPLHFTNTVANLPTSHVSIYFNIKRFNSTISTGSCFDLDVIFNIIYQDGQNLEKLLNEMVKQFTARFRIFVIETKIKIHRGNNLKCEASMVP